MTSRPRVTLTPLADPSAYAALADQPGATPFHDHTFLSALAPHLSMEFRALSVDVDGESIGVAPIMVRRLGPVSSINWVPFPYLGPLVPDEHRTVTLDAVYRLGWRLAAVNHQQSFARSITAPEQLTQFDDVTYVIDVAGRSADELWQSVTPTRRTQIGRAERAGLTVTDGDLSDVAALYPHLAATFARQGEPVPYSLGAITSVYQAMRETNSVHITAVRDGDRAVAASVALLGHGTLATWLIMSDPAYAKTHASAAAMWRHISRASSLGARRLDMVGAPTAGIAEYKQRFGANAESFTVTRRQTALYRHLTRVHDLRYRVSA